MRDLRTAAFVSPAFVFIAKTELRAKLGIDIAASFNDCRWFGKMTERSLQEC